MRFLLIDKVKELIPGKSATGIKCWSIDNPIFQDHFPGFPVVPGVLLTESMAQLAGRLLEESYYAAFPSTTKAYPVLSIIQKAKFKNFVCPGDQCIVMCEIISIDHTRGSVNAKTFVDGAEVCTATLSFLIGSESDMKTNPYFHKMDEYYHIIQRETKKK